MCGINLIISRQPIEETSIRNMQEATSHRGPDCSAHKIYNQDGWTVAVGANRLMVVDSNSTSNQPMLSDCGNYLLAYNGEVYNYHELKNKLITNGVQFRTSSDTEVVLQWLIYQGPAGIKNLQGMFSFAFVDLKNREVHLARDKHGIKPLYYYKDDERFMVSSSLGGIKASGYAHLNINDAAIADYLSVRHVWGNDTFYSEIDTLEPGVVLTIEQTLKTQHRRMANEASCNINLKEALIESVTNTWQANTTPGLMLSGGIDSTLLLAILNRELGLQGVPAYTLRTGKDEKWANKAALKFQAHQIEIDVGPKEFNRAEEYIERLDQPVADHGGMATWLVAEQAKLNSNVLLSGAGADELFAGYNRHRAMATYMTNSAGMLLTKNIFEVTGILRIIPKRLKNLLKNISSDPNQTFYNFLQIYGIELKNNLHSDKTSIDFSENILENILTIDQRNYLVNDVLSITDHAAMLHGVEVRVPFLNDEVVAMAKNTPTHLKYQQGGKGPLKDILTRYDGQMFTKRKKEGFGLPVAEWFRDRRSAGLWDFINSDAPIFRYVKKDVIRRLLDSHQQGKKDNNMQLWTILVLENWLRRN